MFLIIAGVVWLTIKMRARHSDQEFDSRLIRSWTMTNEITRTFSIRPLPPSRLTPDPTMLQPQKSNKVNIVSTEFDYSDYSYWSIL